MTEWEKAQNGYLYDANYDKEIIEARTRCADLCYEFNNCRPSDTEKQQKLLGQILGRMGADPVITAPFYCDYGFNVSIGKNFYTNHNVTILDCAKVTFGDNVFIASIVNKYKNYFGKSRVVVIQSQLGDPICAYSGNDVYWEVCQDLPKTTKLMIDGKALYIHRANFQIIDKNLL